MTAEHAKRKPAGSVLTTDQEEILDLYISHLDEFYEALKLAEKVQVEIETLHLKKILSK
jgi:hypothetical protein